jgi:hypothetical protein
MSRLAEPWEAKSVLVLFGTKLDWTTIFSLPNGPPGRVRREQADRPAVCEGGVPDPPDCARVPEVAVRRGLPHPTWARAPLSLGRAARRAWRSRRAARGRWAASERAQPRGR